MSTHEPHSTDRPLGGADHAAGQAGEISAEEPGAASAGVADGVERRLDRRWVTLERIGSWIGAGVLALVLLVALNAAAFAGRLPFWAALTLWVAAVVARGWWAHAWPALQYRHAAYTVDALGIEIRRGVLWRRLVNVPRSRVQHTDVSQGPFERAYGLGTLVIYTAGTDHARVVLPGLDHATALRIRDHLLPGLADDAV
jgi:uncharacterized protein